MLVLEEMEASMLGLLCPEHATADWLHHTLRVDSGATPILPCVVWSLLSQSFGVTGIRYKSKKKRVCFAQL